MSRDGLITIGREEQSEVPVFLGHTSLGIEKMKDLQTGGAAVSSPCPTPTPVRVLLPDTRRVL